MQFTASMHDAEELPLISYEFPKFANEEVCKVKLTAVGLVCILALTGCAAPVIPTKDEVTNADYGSTIPLDGFNELAESRLRQALIDPDSLKFYSSTKLVKHWASDPSGKTYYGYLGCYKYNSKNAMGGYAGNKSHCLFVRGGSVLQRYLVSYSGSDTSFYPSLRTIDKVIKPEDLGDVLPESSKDKFEFSLNRLTPRVSNAADAKRLLGEPTSSSSFPNGSSLLQWIGTSGKHGYHVAILFDGKGIMMNVTHKAFQ